MRWPFIFFALAAGLAATGLAVFVGLTTAAAVTHPGCSGVSHVKMASLRVEASRDAINRYWLDHGRCPSSHRPLVAEGYLDEINLRDPWGTNIALACDETGVTVRSAGGDRVFGTADDIPTD